MKKTFLCLLLLFSLFTTLAAQEVQAPTEELNEQYELFSWEPVAKAKQYGVTIEKYDAAQDIWTDYKEIKTKETQVEVLFTPGVYRVSIATYNLIGRKGKGSEWIQFKILEEHIPYLNKRAFSANPDWNAPVLFLNKAGGENSVQLPDEHYINYITPAELFGDNAILVKGRNIFSPKTEFYLVPKDQPTDGGMPFQNYCDDRKEQKLNILYRNSKEYQVVVSYNPALLYPGYYALEVRNPGNNTDAIDILVLDDIPAQIAPASGFAIDEHYNVNSINLTSATETYEFAITAKGLSSAADFYLEPSKGTYVYPFESQLTRNNVQAQVTNVNKQGNSTSQLTLSCSSQELKTGYYNIVAKNYDGTTTKFLCLVKRQFDNDYTKAVKKLTTKYNKRSEYVDITLQDQKFDLYKKYTLVSEYNEVIDSNNKVELTLAPSRKKLTGRLTPDQLTIAKYALMIEDAQSTDVIYCQIDNTLKLSMNKMSDLEVEQTFFRPAGADSQVTLDADEAGYIKFFDNKVQMEKRMPYFFPNMRFDMSFASNSDMAIGLEFDIFNIEYASISLGGEFRLLGETTIPGWFSMLRLAIPNKYFSLYIGAGIGQTLMSPGEVSLLDKFKDDEQLYLIGQMGALLFSVLDVRYNLNFEGFTSSAPYFTDSLSVGFVFPLRPYKFKRNVITRGAQISKPDGIIASDFFAPESNVDVVEAFESTSIGGFAEYNNLVTVTIESTVQTIEENAFRNCKNLEEVVFKNKLFSNESVPLVIKSNAFADDIMISEIRLPARTTVVQAGAFAHWTNGQNIILEWNADDQTQRDLTGLINCSAMVHYQDGTVFNGAYNNPIENDQNWIPINELRIENVSVFNNNKYVLGVRVMGWAEKWYRSELHTWINQETPERAINFLKAGDTITFKVQGDGNKYNFILTTQDGGYFHYKFKTKKDELVTVRIPYKKLKKYNFSSQKKLDIDNLKMFCILPMCKGEWDEVTFFDFEVTK